MPGPIARPEGTLRRPRRRKGSDEQDVVVGVRQDVTWELEPDPDWHPIATQIYESVVNSGQSDYYQDSDWAVLYSICDDISYYKTPQTAVYQNKKTGDITEYTKPRSGQMLASIMSSLTSLLLTEGDRRRVRMELQAPPKEVANLALVGEVIYPDAFGGKAA